MKKNSFHWVLCWFIMSWLVPQWGVTQEKCIIQDLQKTRFEYLAQRMGVPVRIVLYAADEKSAEEASDAVYRRFDELNAMMSDYDPESEIIQLCRQAEETGEFITVSNDLANILATSRHFTILSNGAFDITVSPLVKLWRRSRSFQKLPPEEYLNEAKKLLGNECWELKGNTVRLLKKGVRFDLGGIAKGYALDAALDILREFGMTAVLIDAGGDLRIGDAPPGEQGWNVGFASLDAKASAALYRPLANVGVASSGDTFRFVEIEGVRYSHLIDPRTGSPMTTHQVVSVVAPDATTADALASAVSVLGLEDGWKLILSQENVEAILFRMEEGTENIRSVRTKLFE